MKSIFLHFCANVTNYEVIIKTEKCVFRKVINGNSETMRIRSSAPILRVTARPLGGGYSSIRYFRLLTKCQSFFDLSFNFSRATSKPIAPDSTLNLFTLTDATYGLPIDGALIFTKN